MAGQFCRHSGEQSTPTDRGTLYETVECGEELCEHGTCPTCDGDCDHCAQPECEECGKRFDMSGYCEPCFEAGLCPCGNARSEGDKYCRSCIADEAGDRVREYAKDERGW